MIGWLDRLIAHCIETSVDTLIFHFFFFSFHRFSLRQAATNVSVELPSSFYVLDVSLLNPTEYVYGEPQGYTVHIFRPSILSASEAPSFTRHSYFIDPPFLLPFAAAVIFCGHFRLPDEEVEKKFWKGNPTLGGYINWVIVGSALNASSVEPASSLPQKAKTLDSWSIDKLPHKMDLLKQFLSTAHGRNSTVSTVIYIHCEAGTDRTGTRHRFVHRHVSRGCTAHCLIQFIR